MRRRISVDESGVCVTESKGTSQFVKPVAIEKSRDDTNGTKVEQDLIYKMQILWVNVIVFMVLHVMAFYGFYLNLTTANMRTIVCNVVIAYLSTFGVSVGSHRLWSHRSFKATLPMRILLMLLQSCANQDAIYYWARDHRVHHKYTDTNADPYSISRGFFFAHMGWLMVKKHPDVRKRGKGIDMSDLTSDPVVVFQKRYFFIIMPIMCIIIPTWIPMYLWNETFKVAFFGTMFRYMMSLHFVWCTNSVDHMWGWRPYDRFSSATDNPYIGIISVGESWHNYHHTFPWDYTVSESHLFAFHPSAKFIEFFAFFGLAYDLKTVSSDMAMRQANKNGDGTFQKPIIQADNNTNNHSHASTVWGWDDGDLTSDDRNGTEILAKSYA